MRATMTVAPQYWICVTCGTQFEASEKPPAACPVCEDDRQYVPAGGQAWTTADELRSTHRNVIEQQEPGVWAIHTEPRFGIGQYAYLVATPDGNLLWDCLTLLDDETVRAIRELGGLRAIAVSHPHYYGSMADWSAAFEGAPIHIHFADRNWVRRASGTLDFWAGESVELFGGIRLVRCGGHFDGYQVAHWPAGAGGAGVLFAGDQPQVCMDGKWVTFMYSYPNWIPFDEATVHWIAASLSPLRFGRLYGAFGRNLMSGAKEVVDRSVQRYLAAIAGTGRARISR
jgi:hypothetical protein